MNTRFLIFLGNFIMAGALILGCSAVDDMKEMKNQTKEMGENVERTAETVDETYYGSREALAAELRTQFLKEMKDSRSMGAKVSSAIKYMSAFEFQKWHGSGRDTVEVLQRLKYKAVAQLLRDIREFDDSSMFSHQLPLVQDDNLKNRAAIALALHTINDKQKAASEKSGLAPSSVYSILLDAFKLKQELQRGTYSPETLPDYAKEVLGVENRVIDLLWLRQNFFVAMFISEVNQYDTSPGVLNLPKVKTLWEKFKNYYLGWNLNLDSLETMQIYRYAEWLKQSLHTQRSMFELDYDLAYDSKLLQVLTSMNVQDSSSSNSRDNTREVYKLQLLRWIELIKGQKLDE